VLILHAGLLDGVLALWAERSRPPRGDARLIATRRDVREALAPFIAADAAKPVRGVVAWLPAAGGRVVPSPLLDDEAHEPPNELAPCPVDALALEVGAAPPLLRACRNGNVLAPGVLAGADLAFWWHALRYAATLVAAQRYTPGLEVHGAGAAPQYRAVWRPRIGPDQRAGVAGIAAAMPDACRALAQSNAGAPANAPAGVLRAFLDGAVDAIVRSAAAGVQTASDATPAGRWMRALVARDPTMDAPAKDGATFAAVAGEWFRAATREDDAEHRLCVRLEEPLMDGGPWQVRYLLQSHADPSLLVDVDTAWRNARLRRAFLDAIGKGARLLPQIDATLREARPSGFALDDAGAHAFLTVDAPLLEGEGVGVLLPAWWTAAGTRARLVARATVKRSARVRSGLSLESVVDVNWAVALGGEPLSARELAELARLKAPLVRLRGQWVMVDAQQIRAALSLREKRQAMALGDVVRLGLGGNVADVALPVELVEGSGAVGALLDRLNGRAAFEEHAAPRMLRGTLRPYQLRGYSWLAFLSQLGLGACLADDMGLGKTITTLALVARDWEADPGAPVLLICPTSVIGNWQREIARFAPDLPVVVHHGGERKRSGALLEREVETALVLTSYGVAQRDIDVLGKLRWRGVVLDEAQNVKNADSKQAQAVRALDASYRVALTGTPIENHVGDLWSLMQFLNPGLLGTAASFRREFLIPIGALADADAEARLKRLTGPFVLRRMKSDPAIVADLPKKLETRVFCQLTKEQATLYAAVLREAEAPLDSAEGIERRGVILATIAKLKQVCNHPANLLHDNSRLAGRSGKLARLAEMLEEVYSEGDRALVFTQFTEMAAMLKAYLQEQTGREVLYLHGGVRKSERDRMVERFQESDDAPGVFVLSLRAGGTGLNLTRANHVFHFDRWWNPAVENQASDRAYRIGQKKNVHVHRLICAGTIEDKIDALIQQKQGVADRLVRAGEAGLTDLSNAQLRDLFALGADAVTQA
jgi:superfamily II DNA or RNA helicase